MFATFCVPVSVDILMLISAFNLGRSMGKTSGTGKSEELPLKASANRSEASSTHHHNKGLLFNWIIFQYCSPRWNYKSHSVASIFHPKSVFVHARKQAAKNRTRKRFFTQLIQVGAGGEKGLQTKCDCRARAWNFYRRSCYWTYCWVHATLNRLLVAAKNCFSFAVRAFLNFWLHRMFFRSLQTYKDFTVQKAADCTPINETTVVKVSNLKVSFQNEALIITGTIEIKETLPMNMEMEIAITRCNIDGTGCSFFDKIMYPRICEKMNVKTSVAYKIASGLNPRPQCPVPVGIYEMRNGTNFSLQIFRSMPLEGYLWLTRNTFFEKKANKRLKKLACLGYDVAIVNKVRRTKAKN